MSRSESPGRLSLSRALPTPSDSTHSHSSILREASEHSSEEHQPARSHTNDSQLLKRGMNEVVPGLNGRYQFCRLYRLGKGNWGFVAMGFDTLMPSKPVAVKVSNLREGRRKIFERERDIYSEFQKPKHKAWLRRQLAPRGSDHLMNFMGFSTSSVGDEGFLVLELLSESLQSYLARTGPVHGAAFLDIAFQFLSGLSWLQQSDKYWKPYGAVHLDLKLSNLGWSFDRQVKIFDFGGGQIIGRHFGHQITSHSYSPPERLFDKIPEEFRELVDRGNWRKADEPSRLEYARWRRGFDQWSAGLILYELIMGSNPLHDDNFHVPDASGTGTVAMTISEKRKKYYEIFNRMLSNVLQRKNQQGSDPAWGIIRACIFRNPLKRMGAQELIETQCFDSLRGVTGYDLVKQPPEVARDKTSIKNESSFPNQVNSSDHQTEHAPFVAIPRQSRYPNIIKRMWPGRRFRHARPGEELDH
ncbi:kinase-like protein [Meredithblackwellia eburnea MCA 4105]